jgi:hypothetical protein
VANPDDWGPFPGGQTEFLCRSEFEVLYGGLAGPGKTEVLVAALSRDVANPNYRGLLLRRTYPELEDIMDRCWKLYPRIGGVWRESKKRWFFPSGAFIKCGQMEHEKDKYKYQGKEYHRIGFDELTQFTESQYLYVVASRVRTTADSVYDKSRWNRPPVGQRSVCIDHRAGPDLHRSENRDRPGIHRG